MMRKLIIPILLPVLLAGCSGRNHLSDAYGNFETREFLVAAEGQGKIMELGIEEGDVLHEGQIVGYIDTMELHLQVRQLEAKMAAVAARRQEVSSQIGVLESQKKNLLVEKQRLEKLLAGGAATGKQMDDMNGQLATLGKQIEATGANFATIKAEIRSLQAQARIVRDRLDKNLIVNPVNGTVLEKYAEPFEMSVPGRTLYKIGDLGTMILRVYISGEQLPSVKIGQEAGVIIDDPATRENPLPGRVTWISGEAEFTPKIIQTREERVNLVYAVKVEVSNDGRLKIGMPGEVVFKKAGS